MDEQKQVIDPNVNTTGQVIMNQGNSTTFSLINDVTSAVKQSPVETIKDQASPPTMVKVLTPETHLNIIEKVEAKVQAKIDEVINEITVSLNKEEDKVKKEIKAVEAKIFTEANIRIAIAVGSFILGSGLTYLIFN